MWDRSIVNISSANKFISDCIFYPVELDEYLIFSKLGARCENMV